MYLQTYLASIAKNIYLASQFLKENLYIFAQGCVLLRICDDDIKHNNVAFFQPASINSNLCTSALLSFAGYQQMKVLINVFLIVLGLVVASTQGALYSFYSFFLLFLFFLLTCAYACVNRGRQIS